MEKPRLWGFDIFRAVQMGPPQSRPLALWGKEGQRSERTPTFEKSRGKRYIACPDVAQRVGFEPTVPLLVHLISSQGRYNHFDTAAWEGMTAHCVIQLRYPIPGRLSIPFGPGGLSALRRGTGPEAGAARGKNSGCFPIFLPLFPTFSLISHTMSQFNRFFICFFVHLDFTRRSSYNMVYKSTSYDVQEPFT